MTLVSGVHVAHYQSCARPKSVRVSLSRGVEEPFVREIPSEPTRPRCNETSHTRTTPDEARVGTHRVGLNWLSTHRATSDLGAIYPRSRELPSHLKSLVDGCGCASTARRICVPLDAAVPPLCSRGSCPPSTKVLQRDPMESLTPSP